MPGISHSAHSAFNVRTQSKASGIKGYTTELDIIGTFESFKNIITLIEAAKQDFRLQWMLRVQKGDLKLIFKNVWKQNKQVE